MDDKCKIAHARLLAGICPWCRQYVLAGEVEDVREKRKSVFHQRNLGGKSIQQFVEQRDHFSLHSVLTILEQIASRVSDVHSDRGMIGLLCPSTILLLGNSIILIETSEVASYLDDPFQEDSFQGDVDQNSPVLGVADYLAPEQAISKIRPDERADIYSLGCIFFFLLTGQPPFSGSSISERLLKHQTEKPPSILQSCPDAPAWVERMCEKMLEKLPQDRYQSADELVAELKSKREDS